MRRYTESDYHELAASKDLEWIGDVLPDNVLAPTEWRCKRAGHVFKARAANVMHMEPLTPGGYIQGRNCPKCTHRWRRGKTDYHKLAKRHGLDWMSAYGQPKTTRDPTAWQMADGKVLVASYRALDSRQTAVSDTGARANAIFDPMDEDGIRAALGPLAEEKAGA